MDPRAAGEEQKLRTRARIFLLGAVSDGVLALAAFLWGDRLLPAQRVPGIEWTLAQSIGAAFLVAGAVQFLLYSRVRRRIERAPVP